MRLIDADELKDMMIQAYNDALPDFSVPWQRELAHNVTISLMADIDETPTVDAVPVCVLKEILMRYFDIGDSYHFELTRVKEAFEVGTMSLDDFQEWTEENVDDLVEYIKKNCADGEHKGGES